tara:strand:+ start:37080 stop:37220 length:141 start_codon:yes stop_codon:yes gene_type:complete
VVEHFLGKEEVAGSIPAVGSLSGFEKLIRRINTRWQKKNLNGVNPI